MELKEEIKRRYFRNGFGVIHEREIKKLASEFSVTESIVKKDLKACNCEIYKEKPKKCNDYSQFEEQINTFILTEEMMKPKYAQYKTVREKVGKKLWDKTREELLKQNSNTCQICSYHTQNPSELHVHEEWMYDEENYVLKLVGVRLICEKCHSCKHIANSVLRTENIATVNINEIRDMHMMRVNRCSQDLLIAYRNKKASERYKKCPENWNLYLNMLRLSNNELWKKEIDTYDKLCNAEWKIEICCDIPYRQECIDALKNKGLYREN